jgi:type VI secretion system protein ImpG
MDARMLRYYNQELQYMREMGAEFAAAFPKIAARLALDATEVADPYVERLLEGFSFLSARVRLKLDAEFPRFTQHLLECVYPHYLAPTPSMAIVQFTPAMTEGSLAAGFTVPRGTVLRGQIPRGEVTACQFRTAHELTLWPVEVVEARYAPFAPDLPLNTLGLAEPVQAVLRLRLRTPAPNVFKQIAMDRLNLFLAGGDELALKLYELILGSGLGVFVGPPARPVPWFEWLGRDAIQSVGFDRDQALIPYTTRSFSGYRLLHEYFAFPERFRFVELVGLKKALARHAGDELELAIPLARADGTLGALVDKSAFALHCVPAVNLFTRRADRIHVTDQQAEHHVVVDRTKPMDFEVYSVDRVVGHGEGLNVEQEFRPFYATVDADGAHPAHGYFTVRREPRALSERQRRDGARTSYMGSEVSLSLVDAREAPYSETLRQLGVDVLVTNRDLPLLMPIGSDRDFSLAISAPVEGIRCLRGPSRPRPAVVDGEIPWRLTSHLSLNYLTVDETSFAGGSAFLLGAVLEQVFGRLASMNTFTELTLISERRGEIKRWPPRMAARQLV